MNTDLGMLSQFQSGPAPGLAPSQGIMMPSLEQTNFQEQPAGPSVKDRNGISEKCVRDFFIFRS